jgi:hypothetical protein
VKKIKPLKEFQWEVHIIQHNPGWMYYTWAAHSDKFIIETKTQYNSAAHARGSFREFARNEGLKDFTVY